MCETRGEISTELAIQEAHDSDYDAEKQKSGDDQPRFEAVIVDGQQIGVIHKSETYGLYEWDAMASIKTKVGIKFETYHFNHEFTAADAREWIINQVAGITS